MKKLFMNLSIKTKITLTFGIFLFLFLVLSVLSAISLQAIDNEYNYVISEIEYRNNLTKDVALLFSEIRRNYLSINLNPEDKASVQEADKEVQEYFKQIQTKFDAYLESVENDTRLTEEEKNQETEKLKDAQNRVMVGYKYYYDKTLSYANSNKNEEIKKLLPTIKDYSNNEVIKSLNILVDESAVKSEKFISDAQRKSDATTNFVLIFSLVIIIFAFIVSYMLSAIIVKPIKKLINLSNKVGKGDFSSDYKAEYKDELSVLANDMVNVVGIFNELSQDINNISQEMFQGNTEVEIDYNKYAGEYQNTAAEISNMALLFNQDIETILECLQNYAEGNFEYTCPRFPGKKAAIHNSLDKFQLYLKDINKDINYLVNSVLDGNLNNKVDSSSYEGDWKIILDNLNNLMMVVSYPIKDVSNVMKEVSKGNLGVKIESEYKGEFNTLKSQINSTIEFLVDYIKDISNILTKISNQNLDISIENEYIGDFVDIKKAMELIINNLNGLVTDINSSAEQVAIGAKSMADSSCALAQGSTEQASSIARLTETIETVAKQTNTTTINAKKANIIAEEAKQNAELGNKEMENMLKAMEEINISSNNIANIIKIIEDIAFQTNLLSLNAAIEAARAGEHGKGFAVVAEEVRNLAARSQKSAKETSSLIEISVDKAKQGMEISSNTAEALNVITNKISDIAEIISEVSSASQTQNELIKEINTGINQISDVITTNSAASEESASASQQLASQAEVFKESISKFKLKENNI